VCELLVATFETPRPFRVLAPIASCLEELGVAGFGWGVAWLDDQAREVRAMKGVGRFREEGRRRAALPTTTSRRFVVHLRRPARLSTTQLADTQPFVDEGRSAWCHDGLFARAEELRPAFVDRLRGQADSEVGWQYFLDRSAEGADAVDALRSVDDALAGRVNLAYLGRDGEMAIYSRNDANRFWRFSLDGGRMAATGLYSSDNSLFDFVVPRATDRELVPPGRAMRMAAPDVPVEKPRRSTRARDTQAA
jgi:predicted glutamine amidotransferase